MDRRIFGIETEFGISYVGSNTRRLAPEEAARYLFRKVVSWGRSSNVFLANGSRLYLDVGSHPEYATAECDSLPQLIAHDKAGELILEELCHEAEERLSADGFEGRIFLFKNNTVSAGHSYGSHETYLLPRKGGFNRLADVLIPFLVTRQLLVGAGKIINTPQGALYAFSQRADHIWEGVSSATTRSRPIINTRDEPHADAEFFRRLHVIVGDSTMSETTALLKTGSVDLVLRALEAGAMMRDMRMENPIRSIREISRDLSGQVLVKLATGRQLTALQIQEEYLQWVTDFVEREGAHHEHVGQILDLWGRTLQAIRAGDHSGIDTEIDWAIKKKLMDRYALRHGLGLDSPRLAQIDLTYHDISRKRGLFYLTEQRGLARRVVTEEATREAGTTAPQTTRARLRGEFVRKAQELGRDYTVDWVHLKLNDRAHQTVICKDPFAAHDERVDALIAGMG